MEKPGNWFATVKNVKNKAPERKKKLRKGSASLLKNSLWDSFLFPDWANQSLGFFVRGTSTPNGLFQTIKILMSYTKRLHRLKHGVLFHLKFENLELFVNY